MNIPPITDGVSNTTAKKSSMTKKKEASFAQMLSSRMDTYESGKKAISEKQKKYLQKKYNIKDGDLYFNSEKTKKFLKELESMGILSKEDVENFGEPITCFTKEEGAAVKESLEKGQNYNGSVKKVEGYELMRYEAGRNRNLYEGLMAMSEVQKYYADTYPGDRKEAQSLYERSAMYQRIADALKEAFEL